MSRFDPYRNFKFRLTWQGRTIAGMSKASPLKRTTEVVRDRTAPPRSAYEAITLERGVTHDPEFEAWANRVHSGRHNPATLQADKRDLRIELYNEAGQRVLTYIVYGCWVSDYQALPDLDAGANAVLIQRLKLENEGWERDDEVGEPSEPPL